MLWYNYVASIIIINFDFNIVYVIVCSFNETVNNIKKTLFNNYNYIYNNISTTNNQFVFKSLFSRYN